jgi:hypothetical protein
MCRQRYRRPLRASVRESAASRRAGLACEKLALAGWSAAVPLERSVEELFEYFANAR